jgi:hypothetical protein
MGLVLALLGASCGHTSPEDFCTGWVEQVCNVAAGCCVKGTVFDKDVCRVEQSDNCQRSTRVEDVHAGTVVFDAGAATACLGDVKTCADLTPPSTQEATVQQACANMITGFRPAGAACDSDGQCQKAGDFGFCNHNPSVGGQGLCVQALIDDTTCSFDAATSTVHVCADGTYCDFANRKHGKGSTPTEKTLDYSAKCLPYIAKGGSCIDPSNDTDLLPCQAGLYCNVTGANTGTCITTKAQGDTCSAEFGVNQCAAGLVCIPDSTGTGATTCRPTGGVSAVCAPPASCGNGKCDPGETTSICPQDCQGNGPCGDGVCEPGENVESCPNDCPAVCGDGICSVGPEDQNSCPKDCGGEGFCGDMLCAPNENPATCPQDCGMEGFCGDGVCGPGEDSAICPQDCGGTGCLGCACMLTMSQGGCADICSMSLNGTTTPNFCDGAMALAQCAACIETSCGGNPGNCH